MVLPFRHRRLTLSFATFAALTAGVAVALLLALAPRDMIESLAVDSGVAAVLPAAEPPLGATARAMLVVVGAGGIALIAWIGTFLLFGDRPISFGSADADGADAAPAIRRADAHPDANPRRPLSAARDLPPPSVARHIEDAVFEPVPAVEPQPVPELQQPVPATRERLETFELPHESWEDAELTPVLTERGPERRSGWRLPTPAADYRGHRVLDVAPTPLEPVDVRPIAAPAPSEAVPEWLQPADLRLVVPTQAEAPSDRPVLQSPARASLEQLIARLEQGVERAPLPAPVPPPPRPAAPPITQDIDNLERTLATLRRLGRGVG